MKLDLDENLHLAMHASSTGQHHACLSYLSEVLNEQPDHPKALHLLASQHAELGLTERAIEELTRAVRIDPRMEIARFQLSLLLLDKKRHEDAVAHLLLLGSSASESLRLFSQGVLALAKADTPQAMSRIAAGLAAPAENPALSKLMQRLLEAISPRTAGATAPDGPNSGEPVFLGAYRETTGSTSR